MRKIIPTILSAFLIAAPIPVLAFGQNDVPSDMAERGMALAVSPEGCVVNVTTGSITAIALSDRSRFVYTQVQNSVYIKPIQHQQFEGIVSMHDGSTTLRIWVGNKILRFKVRYVSSGARDLNIIEKTQFASLPKPPQKQAYLPPAPVLSAPIPTQTSAPTPSNPIVNKPELPTYTAEPVPLLKPVATFTPEIQKSTEEIKPENQPKPKKPKRIKDKKVKPQVEAVVIAPAQAPAPKVIAIALPPKPVVPLTPQKLSVSLLKGLNAARIQKKVAYQSRTWNQVQNVIISLRRGTALDTAIARSGVKKSLIQQYLKLGGASV